MFAIPSLSGAECVELLQRFGYRMGLRSTGLASMRRETNVVIIPLTATLTPALVRALLRTAKIDPVDFERLFPSASSSLSSSSSSSSPPPSQRVA